MHTHTQLAAADMFASACATDGASLPPEFFRALEVARTQALVCLDMERVNAPHAPECHLISPSGKLFTRERCVCAIAAQTFYAEWDLGDVSVRVSPAW